MRLTRIEFDPRAIIMITRKELNLLIKCSERHYDAKCKAMSQPGGELFGMRNKMRPISPPTASLAEHSVTWSDCDLMRKVLEQATSDRTSEDGQTAARLSDHLLQTMHQLSGYGALEARPRKLKE